MKRPFETDYAGAWRGHCITRESAIIAAMKHVVQDGYARATITDQRTGEVVAKVFVSANRRTVEVDTVKALRPSLAKLRRVA